METNGVERKRRRVAGLTSEEMRRVRFEIATEVVIEIARDILADLEREKITADDLLRALIEKLGLRELR